MKLLLNILNFIFGWALKAWRNRGPSRLETVNEQLGEKTEALTIESKSDDEAAKAVDARDSMQPLTASELPNHNPSNDPDFRD